MKLTFKDIKPGIYPAKITDIIEEDGPYGPFLRFHFTVTCGDLSDWTFYGIVKPNAYKQAKFYRWATIIIGMEPSVKDIDIYQFIGKECDIMLDRKTKGNKVYYSVKELVQKTTETE
jgi:hypothetical protein